MKICSKCKIEKPLSNFHIRKDRNKPLSRCKDCLKSSTISKKEYERRQVSRKKYEQSKKEIIAEKRKIYYIENKEEIDKKNKEWISQNKEKSRNNHYKRTYGITINQYNELLEKQNYSCAVCHKHENEFNIRLAVDHDHKTGEIRGLLCSNCNHRIIGRHREPLLLKAAYEYLSGVFTGWFVPKRKKRRSKKKLEKIEIVETINE